MPRRLFLLLLGLTALLLCARSYAAGKAEAAYARGVAAFRAGDYRHALDDFRRARAEGYRGVQLDYSLGATYYRLGRYDSAKQQFEKLLAQKSLAALAHYNLGLIAAAQDERAVALREYRAAYATASQAEIKQLAAAEIARLAPPPSQPARWFGYARLSAGYDDNVAFAPQSGVIAPSRQGSTLISLLAGGAGQLTGSYANGLQIFGSYYSADYPRLSLYDETMLNLGSQYRYTTAAWSAQAGISGSDVTLGGAGFETLAALQFAAEKTLTDDNRVAAGYEYQHVNAATAFDYLGGWQEQLFIEDRIAGPDYQATVGYQHEINRRNDLTLGNEFLSASPIRNRLYAQLTLHTTDWLSWEFGLIYEKSLYGKPDVLVSGNSVVSLTRDDALYLAHIGVEYTLAKAWRLSAAYRYLRNASNIGIYSYRSNRYSLAIKYLFY